MSISSLLSTGMQSMQASINRTAIAGGRLNVDNASLAGDMVAMRQGAADAGFAADVIKTGDEILGTIINIRA